MILKLLYWLAVLAVSLALLVALVLFFVSRDSSQLGSVSALLAGVAGPLSRRAGPPTRS